jgi:hypothetical protein
MIKKAGFYDAKKDKAKRLSIINKVTTKPERIEMVDKVFSVKKCLMVVPLLNVLMVLLLKAKLKERSANETFTWYGRYKEN